ncbi:hypothetical protein AB0C84_43505 [Actinomadura sp. NPDC048955]|uniref:hypothetical protein n=1 Tax=Actinomadura sp. NPDC048955 TaxID=3158228 RepID=UPI00340F0973
MDATDKLIRLAEMHWNRMQNSFGSLQSSLTEHGLNWEKATIAQYSGWARQYYGEWGTERFAVGTSVSMIIGDGQSQDYTRALSLVDEWVQQRLLGFQVAQRLRELASAPPTEPPPTKSLSTTDVP